MRKLSIFPLILLLLGFTAVDLLGQEAAEGASKSKGKEPKAYADVITAEAQTDEGLFTVHKVGSKYFFEIPLTLLEEEILVVSRISGHVKNLNFGGAGMK